MDFVSTHSKASAGHREESMWCLLVRPSYQTMLVKAGKRSVLLPYLVSGFRVRWSVLHL